VFLPLQRGRRWRPGAHHDQRTVARGQTERGAAAVAGRGRRRCGRKRGPEATATPATSAAAATGGGQREHHHNGRVAGKRVRRETVAGGQCATAARRPNGAQ